MVDSRLSFIDHFNYLGEKTAKVVRALGRLMPNLRGSGECKRRLYANVVLSVLLYGASLWSDALSASCKIQTLVDRLQRTLAIRVISGYRTVSLDAANLLARIPPLHLLARARKRSYERVRDLVAVGLWSEKREVDIKREEELLMRRQWELYLDGPGLYGSRTREAILPNFNQWLDRGWGSMAFRLTQLLTGHGCFGTYLFRIGKVESAICEHCTDKTEDSTEHTWQECSAWNSERDALKREIGDNLTLEAVIAAMCYCKEAWVAVIRFAEGVMLTKEILERERQMQEALANSSVVAGFSGSTPMDFWTTHWMKTISTPQEYVGTTLFVQRYAVAAGFAGSTPLDFWTTRWM
ncbi:uncharacterized protein LOC115240092 [Formica exsecta]|uniref:uncharacterized protein LOC115240092 n=1 Tax=Formica exsecta TaxID=72781 RepID=UPI001141202B|nr:uncharacterized protein LOC115240092 [Formica exsecta]